jgi:hypothetical protein
MLKGFHKAVPVSNVIGLKQESRLSARSGQT